MKIETGEIQAWVKITTNSNLSCIESMQRERQEQINHTRNIVSQLENVVTDVNSIMTEKEIKLCQAFIRHYNLLLANLDELTLDVDFTCDAIESIMGGD